MTQDYKTVAADKAASLLAKIPRDWILKDVPSADEQPNTNTFVDSLLPDAEKDITNKSAAELLELQKSGKLTAYEITHAFCHRTALVHQLTNCCTEIFFERAFETAKQLDDYFQKNGTLMGKLHGIPISLKDQINLPGITTAIGYIAPHISEEFEKKITHRTSREDISLIAKILQNQGAVFYVKTTVPMAMFGGETSSNLDITYNSLDRHMSCGGSSGGEGALIAAKGSIIGLGTDIGGSIRIPSTVHGLYGLRASSNRFPYLNIANSYPNQIAVCSVVGPLCRNIDDLILVSDIILSDALCDVDPKHVPVAWNSSIANGLEPSKVKLGFLKWDGEILPHTPITNNLENLQVKLDQVFCCSTIDPSSIPVKFSTLGNLLLSLYSSDNFDEMEEFCNLSGEPFSPMFQRCFKRPNKVDSVSDFCDKAGLKYEYQRQFDKIFEDVDCFIMPTYSAVNWKEGECNSIANFYTRALNVLDYTAMSFPVGKVTANDTTYTRDNFINEMDENNWKYYNLEDQIGKTVSLQLVCKRYHEEECCAIVKRITDILNK